MPSPPTPMRRRYACKAPCDGASRRSRTFPHRRATPDSCGQTQSTKGRKGLPQAWAGSRPHEHARAKCPGAHDALHLLRSQVTPCGPGPRVLPTPLGRFYVCARSLAERAMRAKRRRQIRERKGGDPKIAGSVVVSGSRVFGVPLRGRLPVLRWSPCALTLFASPRTKRR